MLQKILLVFAFLLVGLTGSASAATYWADPSLYFDDNINGTTAPPYTISNLGSPVVSYLAPNTVVCSPAYCNVGSFTTPLNFTWTTRFRVNTSGVFYLMWNQNGSTYDSFRCAGTTGICSADLSNTVLATAGSAIPSTCYNSSAYPSTWCWAKIIRNGATASFLVAPDNNGRPGTFVQYLTANTFDTGTAGKFGWGQSAVVPAGMQLGGGNYPCISHISTSTTYDCFQFSDPYFQYNDNFWSTTVYSGNAPAVASNTLTVTAAGATVYAFHQPFGSTIPSQFTWTFRVNTNSAADSEVALFNSTGTNAGAMLKIMFATGHAQPYLVGCTAGCPANVTIAGGTGVVNNPTAPFYMKAVYKSPNLTVYTGVINADGSVTWSANIPATNVSAYTSGTYFGWQAFSSTFTIGGGSTSNCQNNWSTNTGWDCFMIPVYTRNLKNSYYAPTAFDSFNDATKMSGTIGTAPTVSAGSATWPNSTGSQVLETATSGFGQNPAVFSRITPGASGSSSILLRLGANSAGAYTGCYLHLYFDHLTFSSWTGASGASTNGTYSTSLAGVSGYVYTYMNGNTQFANIYSESSAGVVGSLVYSGSAACAVNPTGGYVGLANAALTGGAYGGAGLAGWPLIMRNYGTLTPPPNPPLGYVNAAVNNFTDMFVGTTLDSTAVNGLSATYPYPTTPLTGSNEFKMPYTASGGTSFQNAVSMQNRAAVIRVEANGFAFSAFQPFFVPLIVDANNRVAVYVNSTGNLLGYQTVAGTSTTIATSSGTIGSSPTNAYDLFAATQNGTLYAQICPETSIAVPNYSACVSISPTTISASIAKIGTVGYAAATNNASTGTTYVGGAYPLFQVRDYGDGQVPQTLSQFLRGY